MKTSLMLALQILDKIEILHNLGYVYTDVKPDNFLVGLGSESPFIFIIDFGHCKRYKNELNGQHIFYKENPYYTHNPIFASLNSHNNIQASRRDDIESFLYVLTYLRLGKLPWAKNTEVAMMIDLGKTK
jgi:serine/threonine protein kinase